MTDNALPKADDVGPLVSIVIPAYNYARYLDEAIRSVLRQDYPRIELIVLDDGSTDETPEVLARYAGRLHFESQPNMGQARTINKGWGMAKGEILAYLSADDFLMEGAVSSAVEALRAAHEVVLVYCDFNLVDRESRALRTIRAPDFNFFDMAVRFVCPPGPGAFLRRDAFRAAGGWDGTLRQIPDYEYWLRLALQGPFLRIPRVMAAWRIHAESQTIGRADPEKADEMIRVVSRFFTMSTVPEHILSARREALGYAHLFSARSHIRSGRYRQGISRLWRALSLYPPLLWARHTRGLLLNSVRVRFGLASKRRAGSRQQLGEG
jgi:glycosyltransferase involved in cell wall biosynthesis